MQLVVFLSATDALRLGDLPASERLAALTLS